MKTDKDLITITQTYLKPKNYKEGDILELGLPILMTANGIPIFQNDSYVTKTKKITEEDYRFIYLPDFKK